MNAFLRTLLLAVAFLAGTSGAALAAPEAGTVELKMEQFEEVVVLDAKGKQVKKIQPLAKTVPGKEVIYRITYRNKGTKPADAVVIRNPVPAELLYQAGSAQGTGTQFEVSVDGGATYGDLAKLTVAGADGKPRPAEAKDVNALRWKVLQPVKAGGEGTVSYRALVK